MSFFTAKTEQEYVKDTKESNVITKSGIYELTINAAIVSTSPKGSQFIDLWVKHKDADQMFFRVCSTVNNDGTINEYGMKLFNKLCIVCGISDVDDPVIKTLPLGKGKSDRECAVLEDFDNIPIKARIQFRYSMFNDQISENRIFCNFFRFEDNATAEEIVNDVENKGIQYQKEAEYADRTRYLDGITEEDVKKWRKASYQNKRAVTPNSSKESSPRKTFVKKF